MTALEIAAYPLAFALGAVVGLALSSRYLIVLRREWERRQQRRGD